MEYLSLNDILGVDDTRYVTVDVWGGKMRLGSLSAAELVEHTERNQTSSGRKMAGVRLILKSMVDADGHRIGRMDQADALNKKSIVEISKVVAAIWKLNGRAREGGVDIGDQLRAADGDTVKLLALSAELRVLAERVEDAASNEEKLKQLIDEPEERAVEARKKGSNATGSDASPTASPAS